ncbi:hypothetical protein P886_2642 [Alteromonadaceae bacterium 2753L.S.0a.02]|nr:hypothetical protein P886_2642 [Alteromonadaceae bacterium 2753L.S.0a.02]
MLNSQILPLQLPKRVGIGLKAQHYQDILEHQPDLGFLEIHPENYMGDGGPQHRYLEAIRNLYPVSMHGVGLSLGSTDGIDRDHLQRLKTLCERYQPHQVSEHLSWSHVDNIYFNDLLPLPYTHETLALACDNVLATQDFLKRTIIVENPSTYVAYKNNDYIETEFLKALVEHTDCGLLLDINNIFVSATNNGFDPYAYIDQIDPSAVVEVHLAGHSETTLSNGKILRIDNHGSKVKQDVWQLFKYFLQKTMQPVATLIEWDTDIPPLKVLLDEAETAEKYLRELR